MTDKIVENVARAIQVRRAYSSPLADWDTIAAKAAIEALESMGWSPPKLQVSSNLVDDENSASGKHIA